MRLGLSAENPRPLSLTPIIDVVFLLLMFFMLASSFARHSHVDVAIGGSAQGAIDTQQMPVILLSISGAGAFSVNGVPVPAEEISSALVSAAPGGKARIAVRPTSDATAQDIVSAIERSQAVKLGPVIMVR